MKKKIIILVGVVLVIMLGVLGYLYINKNKDTDGKKFAGEYVVLLKIMCLYTKVLMKLLIF